MRADSILCDSSKVQIISEHIYLSWLWLKEPSSAHTFKIIVNFFRTYEQGKYRSLSYLKLKFVIILYAFLVVGANIPKTHTQYIVQRHWNVWMDILEMRWLKYSFPNKFYDFFSFFYHHTFCMAVMLMWWWVQLPNARTHTFVDLTNRICG